MACTAWKQEGAFKAEHARPQATFYRICKTCEQTQVCSVCNARKDEKKFSAGAWKRARTGGRVCLDCSGKAWGWWRCSVYKVKQAACAFESWLAQHRSCNGDQVCSNCWKCPIKAVQRVAATQAKVARRAAEEKKARAIADVWDAIAERKRNREQESSQTKEAEPKAKHPKQENGTEMTTEGPADVHGKREDSNGRQTAVRPTKAEAMAKGKIFQYVCPHCNQSVSSTIRTGQVDHRRTCGKDAPVRNRMTTFVPPAMGMWPVTWQQGK